MSTTQCVYFLNTIRNKVVLRWKLKQMIKTEQIKATFYSPDSFSVIKNSPPCDVCDAREEARKLLEWWTGPGHFPSMLERTVAFWANFNQDTGDVELAVNMCRGFCEIFFNAEGMDNVGQENAVSHTRTHTLPPSLLLSIQYVMLKVVMENNTKITA